MTKGLLTALGVVVGYAMMVVLITLVQEVWFGGVGWNETPFGPLAVAGLFTCVAGAIGAIVACAIARLAGRLAAVVMAILTVVETTVLLLGGTLSGPLWFDVASEASLAAAILIGGEIYVRYLARPEARSALA